jgi:hypothetical protein
MHVIDWRMSGRRRLDDLDIVNPEPRVNRQFVDEMLTRKEMS